MLGTSGEECFSEITWLLLVKGQMLSSKGSENVKERRSSCRNGL